MRYALRRLGFFVVTLWIALTLNFFLPRLMPGNPALAMMSKFHGELSPKALNALEILFGVNTKESLLSQYFGYLHQILTGNFGTSLSQYPASVSSVIGSAIWWTVKRWVRNSRPMIQTVAKACRMTIGQKSSGQPAVRKSPKVVERLGTR